MTRSRNYTIAAILHLVLSLASFALGLIELPKGAAELDVAKGGPPYFTIVAGLLIGALGLVSTYGVWRSMRWGVILTILLRVVDSLLALPAILFGPQRWMWLGALIGVVLSIAVIALLLLPPPRVRGLTRVPTPGDVQ